MGGGRVRAGKLKAHYALRNVIYEGGENLSSASWYLGKVGIHIIISSLPPSLSTFLPPSAFFCFCIVPPSIQGFFLVSQPYFLLRLSWSSSFSQYSPFPPSVPYSLLHLFLPSSITPGPSFPPTFQSFFPSSSFSLSLYPSFPFYSFASGNHPPFFQPFTFSSSFPPFIPLSFQTFTLPSQPPSGRPLTDSPFVPPTLPISQQSSSLSSILPFLQTIFSCSPHLRPTNPLSPSFLPTFLPLFLRPYSKALAESPILKLC